MGQQQLLLLVLGIVIVGLAVVVGIQAFSENRVKTLQDQYVGQAVAMTGEIIAWYQKPTAQGGGGGSNAGFSTLTLQNLGYQQTYSDANRTGLEESTQGRFLYRFSNPMVQIAQYPFGTGSPIIEAVVFGPYPECIVSQRGRYGANWTSWDPTPPANPNPAKCSW